MNLIYQLAVGTLYLTFGAFFALIFLAFFDGVTYDEAVVALIAMLVISVVCGAIFELRNQQSRHN